MYDPYILLKAIIGVCQTDLLCGRVMCTAAFEIHSQSFNGCRLCD